MVAYSVDPGVVRTNLNKHIDLAQFLANPPKDYYARDVFASELFQSMAANPRGPSQGGNSIIWAAVADILLDQNSTFAGGCAAILSEPFKYAKDEDKAKKMWE